MLGKETGQNKPVPLGKNWRVNFSCYNRGTSTFLFCADTVRTILVVVVF